MHQIQFYVLISLSVICLLSCNTNCEDKKLGNVALLEDSKSFLPYSEGQKVKFTANDGSVIELNAKVDGSQKSRLCSKFLCSLFSDPFKEKKCEFFEGETKLVSFSNSNNNFIATLGITIDLYQSESELFYDLFTASMSTDGVILDGQLALNPHFTKPKFDETTLAFANKINLKNEITLLGKKFEKVYEVNSNGDYMYIQKTRGIVAFIIKGRVYLLN